MSAFLRADRLCLDVPIFLQRERDAKGWGAILMGAAFDTPKRGLVRLLDDLSFEVNEGDRVAVLGRNGAGKSTLLRVLNEVYQPTSGMLEVRGSCQALLNMSLGFNSEATVRENIFLRGIAMGLTSSFLRHQIDPILEFSGLQEKATHRLRTLSAGQKMRLGFAISTSVQHDIILMDEWVGAGDSEFMARATERMLSRVGGSKIVVLASHSVGLLRDICNKGLVLEKGRLIHFGDITSALKCYHDTQAKLRDETPMSLEDSAASAAAGLYGYVERITNQDDAFEIKGWFVNNEGAVPGGVVMEVNGRRYLAEEFQHQRRPDVMRHLGLSQDECGFRAIIRVPGARCASDLGRDMQIFGGETLDNADTPLKLAAEVSRKLIETNTAGNQN